MNWNTSIRQIHRWLSIAFTVAVIVNFVAMDQENQPSGSAYSPLFPLFLLLFTGLYMFALPYAAKWRGERGADRIGANRHGRRRRKSAKVAKKAAAKPALLSGGNPQIAKGDGDAPVQAYIAAMPGWKRDVGRRLDALIVRTVPGVRKAVKWNSPFYGVEDQGGWFLSFHCFTKYVKVAFFRGTSLRPLPPGESKRRKCATSTSMRATSTKRSSPPG